jgi:hypothetical protein
MLTQAKPMKRNYMYFETQRAKVYRSSYRPSSNLYRMFFTVLAVLLEGQSPIGSSHFYHARKKK